MTELAVVLADAAPTGAGLAIVAVILLAFLAIALSIAITVVVLIVKAVRRGRRPDPAGPVAEPPPAA